MCREQRVDGCLTCFNDFSMDLPWGFQTITSITISPWDPDPNDWDFSGVIKTTIIHCRTNKPSNFILKHEHMNPTCWSGHGFKSYAHQKKAQVFISVGNHMPPLPGFTPVIQIHGSKHIKTKPRNDPFKPVKLIESSPHIYIYIYMYIIYIYTSLYIHILSYTVIASTKTKQTNTVQYCWINIGLSCLSRIIRVKDGQRVKAISPRSQPGDVGSLATWPSPCANALHGETCEVRWDRMGCRGHERGVVSIFEEVKSGETLSIGFVAWFSLPFPLCSKKWSNLKQH